MEIGPDGKPCRACVSFEDMMTRGRELAQKLKAGENEGHKDGKEEAKVDPPKTQLPSNCPVDKDDLGRSTWKLLHTMSVYYPENPTDEDKKNAKSFMNILGKMYPCDFCAKDLRKDLKNDPPKVESRQEFANWMCELHNKVNGKMGKPLFDCKNVFERWRDGWKDGSCDY